MTSIYEPGEKSGREHVLCIAGHTPLSWGPGAEGIRVLVEWMGVGPVTSGFCICWEGASSLCLGTTHTADHPTVEEG